MAKGTIIRFDIDAPKIAKKIKAGQFIILRVNETGERIPLTVADKDEFAGIITIIFQVVGKTTALMRSLNEGDLIKDIVKQYKYMQIFHFTECFDYNFCLNLNKNNNYFYCYS